MHIQCDHTTARLTESYFEGKVLVRFFRKDGSVKKKRTWEFVFRLPVNLTKCELDISFGCFVLVKITGLIFTGNAWSGLPNRQLVGPHARAILDLCLPGILGTVAEILTMQDDGVTTAFAIAQFMGIPGRIEKHLVLDYEVEDESRVRELLAPFSAN